MNRHDNISLIQSRAISISFLFWDPSTYECPDDSACKSSGTSTCKTCSQRSQNNKTKSWNDQVCSQRSNSTGNPSECSSDGSAFPCSFEGFVAKLCVIVVVIV